MVRFNEAGANIKNCPQVPGVWVSTTAGQFSSVPLWKKSSLVFTKPRVRARVQKFCATGSIHAKV